MDKILLTSLIKSDLLKRPIWEHWTEGKNEFVLQTNKNDINEHNSKGHIVLTEFRLKNGKEFIGFCSPQDPSGLDYIQPTIFTNNGQVIFWKDNGWTKEEKEKELKKLGLERDEVFPIDYKTQIKCDGEFYNGTIEDFNE